MIFMANENWFVLEAILNLLDLLIDSQKKKEKELKVNWLMAVRGIRQCVHLCVLSSIVSLLFFLPFEAIKTIWYLVHPKSCDLSKYDSSQAAASRTEWNLLTAIRVHLCASWLIIALDEHIHMNGKFSAKLLPLLRTMDMTLSFVSLRSFDSTYHVKRKIIVDKNFGTKTVWIKYGFFFFGPFSRIKCDFFFFSYNDEHAMDHITCSFSLWPFRLRTGNKRKRWKAMNRLHNADEDDTEQKWERERGWHLH